MILECQAQGAGERISNRDGFVMTGVSARPKVREALCRVARGGIDIHRGLAVRALGRLEDPEAVGLLTEALLDEDEDVRVDAAVALAAYADPRSGEQLLANLLGDPCGEVKSAAIDALVAMCHAEIATWLRRLLKGRDEEIVWDEDEFYSEGWDDWVDLQVKAIGGLAELGVAEAVPDIVSAIDDEHGQDLTEVGFKALARLGDAGIDALVRYARDGNVRRRRRAAAVLAASNAPAAAGAIAEALRDPQAEVRLAVARALAQRRPTDERLVVMFTDVEPEIRAEGVRLCGKHHPEFLTKLLDDEAHDVQTAVLDRLAIGPDLLPGEAVIEKIRSKLKGDSPKPAGAASAALVAVAPNLAFDDLVEQITDTGRPIEVRLGAAAGLARLGGERAIQTLADMLGDDDRQLRIEAAASLMRLAKAEADWPNPAGDALMAALRGELVSAETSETETVEEPEASDGPSDGDDAGSEPEVAQDQDVGDDSAEPGSAETEPSTEPAFPTSTLESILGGESEVADSLRVGESGVELTNEDMERLAMAVRTPRKQRVAVTPSVAPHEDVRRLAAKVLGDLPRDDVAVALSLAVSDADRELRLAAADSLARLGEHLSAFPSEVVDAVLGRISDADRDVRLSLIRALSAAGGTGAANVIASFIDDEDSFVRIEAIRSLSRLGVVAPGVQALLDDPDPSVRSAAAQAVAQSGDARALDLLVYFAFAFGGYHRREAGRLLHYVDGDRASARFVEVLDDPESAKTWQVAIEALEELNLGDRSMNEGPMA